jgi:DNA replication protein DnaC
MRLYYVWLGIVGAASRYRVKTWSVPRLHRVGTRSTIITSQLPLEHWHAWLQDPTLADAILDRLVHQAHKLPLKGESMRKTSAKPSSASAS